MADTAMSSSLKSHLVNNCLLDNTATSTPVMSYSRTRPKAEVQINKV